MALYANRLSTKESDNVELQTAIKNLQEEVKNPKAKVANLKREFHYVGTGAANKDNGKIALGWKLEGQAYHPTWWSTTYS